MWKRYRHLFAYLTLALVPVILVAATAFIFAKSVITRQALNQVDAIATLVEQRVTDYLDNNEALFKSFSTRLQPNTLNQNYSTEQLLAVALPIIQEAKNSIATFRDIDILDPRGVIVTSTQSPAQPNTAVIAYITGEPSNEPRTILYKDTQDHLGITVVGPLKLNGQLIGYGAIDLDPETFDVLTKDINGLGDTGEVALARRNEAGNALTLTALRFDPGSQLFRVTDKADTSKPIIRALAGMESTHQDTIDYRGERVLAATRYLEKPDWGLSAKIDQDEAYAPLRRFGISLIVLLVLIMILSTTGAVVLYRKERGINRAMDEFVSLASHQLRTPATKVKMMLGMLLEGYHGKMSEPQKQVLQGAYDSNDGQIQVVNDLLHVATIDSAQMNLNLKPTDISALVKEVTAELKPVIEATNQTLKVQLPARPVEAWADPPRLRMVMENLLTNAHKYTPPKGKIWVRLQKRPKSFVLSVRDNGVGIAQKDQDKLFKKFSRIHNTLSAEGGGTGLGLYLSHKLVSLHRGTLNVSSKPGKGSTFSVEVPLDNPQVNVRELLHLKKPA